MKKVISVVGMAAVLGSATAFADPDPTRVPLANAAETVAGNLAEHPDNRGLQNAFARIRENIARQQAKRENHPPGQQKKAAGGTAGSRETLVGAERTQRAERAERVERVDRPDRPERPERPDRPDRPDRPHR